MGIRDWPIIDDRMYSNLRVGWKRMTIDVTLVHPHDGYHVIRTMSRALTMSLEVKQVIPSITHAILKMKALAPYALCTVLQ